MHKKRKFNPTQILQIRASSESSSALADMLGVSASCICKIRNYWVYKEIQHGRTRNLGIPK
jgi:hypothetical protein